MPDQKISQLTAIVTVDNSTDVLPIVDISANTTKKVTPTQLKTSLALDNVDNTSDANKPVSIAQQDALNAKVSSNAAITAGTAPKITFDAKGLVTSGDSLDETDLPTGINANKIGTGVVSTTEFEYLNGVTSAIQTQIDSKQATLVSGTNIKTINGATVLGAGDITIAGNPPSGVAGAIQFSDGSAFASDATNFFWNNTTKRLGIGTNAPTTALDVNGSIRAGVNLTVVGEIQNPTVGVVNINGELRVASPNVSIGLTSYPARLAVRGSGSTSATTSLLVQNSAGTDLFRLKDDKNIVWTGTIGASNQSRTITIDDAFSGNSYQAYGGHRFFAWDGSAYNPCLTITGNNGVSQIAVNSATPTASAVFDINSTTKGFLPPRMTTTQKNAIASPAAGLVVYDSTTNKLCCYNGSTWNDLF